jgi:hypothetical protein
MGSRKGGKGGGGGTVGYIVDEVFVPRAEVHIAVRVRGRRLDRRGGFDAAVLAPGRHIVRSCGVSERWLHGVVLNGAHALNWAAGAVEALNACKVTSSTLRGATNDELLSDPQ